LGCLDATKKEDVERLMNGERADMVFTDPPYAIFGSSTGVGKSIADYKMVIPFFRGWIKNIATSVKIYSHLYICCDWRSYPFIFTVLDENGFEVKNLIVWDKIIAGLGYFYRQRYELVIVAGFSKTNALRRGRVSQGAITDENLWQLQRDEAKKHNASKPLELVERTIKNSSPKENNIVLDLFGGSGSTLIACEKLNRRCFMMEIEPLYIQVIIDRWETFTNQQAKKI